MNFQESVLGRMNGFLYRCRADADYTMLHMTDGVERVFGYPMDEIVGNRIRSFSSLISEDDLARMDEIVGENPPQGLGVERGQLHGRRA